MSRRFITLLFMAAGLVVATALWFRFRDRRVTPVEAPPPTQVSAKGNAGRPVSPRRPRAQAAAGAETESAEAAAETPPRPRLPRESIEQHLALKQRTPECLLAAFRASGDTNYLVEAASRAPDNPRVQSAVLRFQLQDAHKDLLPDDRRVWLERFKSSSPDNALANYLSACDYFKTGQPDAAIEELLEATRKPAFQDYSMDTLLGLEELHRDAGLSPLEVQTGSMAGWAAEQIPELAELKSVSVGMVELKKQYQSSGDAQSVLNLAQMGVALAGRLNGEGAKFVIYQLVGMAIEYQSLEQLPADTPFEFLGGQTPSQRIEALKQQKTELRALAAASQGQRALATPAEQQGYFDRMRLYGEAEAMRWFQSQLAARNADRIP